MDGRKEKFLNTIVNLYDLKLNDDDLQFLKKVLNCNIESKMTVDEIYDISDKIGQETINLVWDDDWAKDREKGEKVFRLDYISDPIHDNLYKIVMSPEQEDMLNKFKETRKKKKKDNNIL